MNLDKILQSKNPYLYRVKSMQTAHDIIQAIMQAFISSSEETIFGNTFFEPIAIAASGGDKSSAEGIDIDITDKEHSVKYAIAVKSGTSVFNADSRKRQEENFASAQKRVRQSDLKFSAIVGYAYGTKAETSRGTAKLYEELAGEDFWTALTGDSTFYKKIIPLIGNLPEKYINQFQKDYAKAENRLIRDFASQFCKQDGSIDWDKLVDFNSGSLARKSREKQYIEIEKVYQMICKDPKSTKKAISEQCHISTSKANKYLKWLCEQGMIIQGYQNKTTGWTVIAPLDLNILGK